MGTSGLGTAAGNRPGRTALVASMCLGSALALALGAGELHAAPLTTSGVAPRLATAPCASNDTHVVGEVVDREGHGVAGATVIARPIAMPVALGLAARSVHVVTDGSGHFQITGLPPGTYWFIALHSAYPVGSSPAVPVVDRLEVAIRLDDPPVSA